MAEPVPGTRTGVSTATKRLSIHKNWAGASSCQNTVGRAGRGSRGFLSPRYEVKSFTVCVCVRIWDSTCQDYRFYTPKSCIRTSLREVNPAHKITFQTFFSSAQIYLVTLLSPRGNASSSLFLFGYNFA